jgi:CysZ protein
MKGNPGLGFRYLLRGLRLLTAPGIRLFVLIPLLLNITIFALLISLSVAQFNRWMRSLLAWLPDWLDFLSWLLWPLAVLLLLVVVMYTFSVIANLIASPFNGLLAEKVEAQLTGQTAGGGLLDALKDAPRAIAKEFRKIGYYLPRAWLVLALSLVPLLNLASPLLWFLLGAWMMALQYCDYPMDNHRYSLQQVRHRLGGERLTSLGFGAAVMLGTMVPGLNLLIMPAAVCGATIYWVERLRGGAAEPAIRNTPAARH